MVTNAAGQSIQSATPPQFQVSGNRGSCDTQGTAETVPGDVASSGTAFKWSDSQYTFNLSTKGKTAGEYRVWVTGLDDGVNHYVDLCLTK